MKFRQFENQCWQANKIQIGFSFTVVSRQRKRKKNLCVLCASVVNKKIPSSECRPGGELWTHYRGVHVRQDLGLGQGPVVDSDFIDEAGEILPPEGVAADAQGAG